MGDWIDQVARELAAGQSRRAAVKKLGGGLAGALLAGLLPRHVEAKPVDRVTVCHRAGKKCELKEVNENALKGHLGHGDVVCEGDKCTSGTCQVDPQDPKKCSCRPAPTVACAPCTRCDPATGTCETICAAPRPKCCTNAQGAFEGCCPAEAACCFDAAGDLQNCCPPGTTCQTDGTCKAACQPPTPVNCAPAGAPPICCRDQAFCCPGPGGLKCCPPPGPCSQFVRCDPDTGCVYERIPGCCADASDCPNDADPCTTAVCDQGTCRQQSVAGCCRSDAQCPDDGNPCTREFCDAATNTCRSEVLRGCCTSDAQCPDDGNPCTKATCVGGICRQEPIPGCCQTNADCNFLCETCEQGTCRSTCPQSGDPCFVNVCEPGSGCVTRPRCPNGECCRDGTGGATCCTACQFCHAVDGVCTPRPENSQCGSTGEVCINGTCCTGFARCFDANNQPFCCPPPLACRGTGICHCVESSPTCNNGTSCPFPFDTCQNGCCCIRSGGGCNTFNGPDPNCCSGRCGFDGRCA